MAKVYNQYEHTFVCVSHPNHSDGWEVHEIVLHTGSRVWIGGCYSMENHPEVKRVGDGTDNGYDDFGNCILSVPADWCSFYTCEEADQIMACIDADEKLLSYAR